MINSIIFFIINSFFWFQYLSIQHVVVLSCLLFLAFHFGLAQDLKKIRIEDILFHAYILNVLIGRKKFAYIGFSPIFITEIVIGLIIFLMLTRAFTTRKFFLPNGTKTYLFIFLLIFTWSLKTLISNLNFGIDALRDSLLAFYCIWAIITMYMLYNPINWVVLKKLFVIVSVYFLYYYLYSLLSLIFTKTLPSFEGFRFGSSYFIPPVAIFFILCFSKKLSLMSIFALIIFSLSILTLVHRSIYIGFIIGLLSIFLFSTSVVRKSIKIYSIFGLIASIGLAISVYLIIGIELSSLKSYARKKATGSGGNVSYRAQSWNIALNKFSKNSFTGYGVGKPLMFVKQNKFYDNTNFSYFEVSQMGGNVFIHNSQLGFLVRFGIIGYSFLFSFYILLFYCLYKKSRSKDAFQKSLSAFSIGLITYEFTYSFFNVVMESPFEAAPFWISIGFAMSICCSNNWKVLTQNKNTLRKRNGSTITGLNVKLMSN